MPIKVTCPKCQGVLHAPDDAGGKKGKCPTCGTVLQIPMGGPSPALSQSQLGGGGVIPPEPQEGLSATPFRAPSPTRSMPEEPRRMPQTLPSMASSPFPLPPSGPGAERPYRGSSTGFAGTGTATNSTEVRKPGEPFSKQTQKASAAATDQVTRSWRATRSGLWWCQAGYFFAFVAIVAYAGLQIAELNGVQLPNEKPGFLKLESIGQDTEIRYAATLIPAALALLCLTLGRFIAGSAPQSSFARGLFKAAGYTALLTLMGVISAIVVTVGLVVNEVAPQLIDPMETTGMIQRGGLAVAAIFAPLSELLFIIALGRLGSGLQHQRLSARGTRFLLFLGFIYAIVGLWTYASSVYGRDMKRMYNEQVANQLNNLGDKQQLLVPGLLLLGAFLLYILYVRLVGAGRQAIRERLESLT